MSDSINDGRTKIIDVPSKAQSPQSNVKRRRRPRDFGNKKVQHHQQTSAMTHDAKQFPIEMTPVIEAVKEYARRTHSLGALQGACALEKLAKQIRTIMPQTQTMSTIAEDADAEAKTLKEYVKRVYEDT